MLGIRTKALAIAQRLTFFLTSLGSQCLAKGLGLLQRPELRLLKQQPGLRVLHSRPLPAPGIGRVRQAHVRRSVAAGGGGSLLRAAWRSVEPPPPRSPRTRPRVPARGTRVLRVSRRPRGRQEAVHCSLAEARGEFPAAHRRGESCARCDLHPADPGLLSAPKPGDLGSNPCLKSPLISPEMPLTPAAVCKLPPAYLLLSPLAKWNFSSRRETSSNTALLSLKDPRLGRILLVSTVVDGETEAWGRQYWL